VNADQAPRPQTNCPVCGRVVQLRTMDRSKTYRLITPLIARHTGRARSGVQCPGTGRPARAE
jgi:hypothetical protein